MELLVTGGAGYIGSHTCIELVKAGFQPVVVDNFSNSKPLVLDRLEKLLGRSLPYYCADVTSHQSLSEIFRQHNFMAVLHFAGLKAVGESSQIPLSYYQNNVGAALTLCDVMHQAGVHNLIFSSSATVYGDPVAVPIRESFSTQATNPYGRSKLMIEEVLRDLCAAPQSPWHISLLRYFNPVGAHKSGLIGEDPQGIPNNLLPYISQVAVGKLSRLHVYGSDYPTVDGTGVRDYIHVVDLARGHVKALQKLLSTEPDCSVYNLGTGRGYSVLEVLRTFEQVCERTIPYELVERRQGDIAECYADAEKARQELSWEAEYDLEQMLKDTWNWQINNPEGY